MRTVQAHLLWLRTAQADKLTTRYLEKNIQSAGNLAASGVEMWTICLYVVYRKRINNAVRRGEFVT